MSLRALADRLGIVAEYVDQTGKETRRTSDETRRALLAVMGVDAHDDESAARALRELDERERADAVAPVRVVAAREGRGPASVVARRPAGARGPVEWTVEVHEETGAVVRGEGRTDDTRDELEVPLPRALSQGYHTVRVSLRSGRARSEGEQLLVVVPDGCPDAGEKLGGHPGFGVVANLYAVRSARNWGTGDLTDLADLLEWAAARGAAFVGVNPLHALRNRGGEISPYSPISRLFRNALYIDVEAVPELETSRIARDMLSSEATRTELDRLRRSDRIDYERVMALKRPILRALHGEYVARHAGRGGEREHECRRYAELQGEALTDFATFMAIEESLERNSGAWTDWHRWPEELRDPRSDAVKRFREEHGDDVGFHIWLQCEIDRQLAVAQQRARDGGAAIGLYQDLAIGSSPAGSDPWMFPELFVHGAAVGAPPDPYSATGQNWGLPPISPHALRRTRYRYWIQLVRSALRHAGALRIDHVLGLFQQFWIPEGKSGTDGAYVRFPTDDLLGIIALEATRAGAVVVGEDLGTVPPDVPPGLKRWKVLSSKVLYFEREGESGFKAAAAYDADALATANTHDMATLEGWWHGRDIELRAEVGLIESGNVEGEREKREAEKQALLDRLVRDVAATPAEISSGGASFRGAVHEFLCETPAVLVGLALDDLIGESEPVNLPGVGPDKYPSWSRKSSLPLESLPSDPDVERALRVGARGAAHSRR